MEKRVLYVNRGNKGRLQKILQTDRQKDRPTKIPKNCFVFHIDNNMQEPKTKAKRS